MTGKRKSSKKSSSSKKDSPEKNRRSSRRRNLKKSESEGDDSGSDNSNDEMENHASENLIGSEKKDVIDGNKEEESGSSDGAWQVKSENGNKGGIPKLKICLQRPPEMASPTSDILHSPRTRKTRKTEESTDDTAPIDSTEDKIKDNAETSESEPERRSTRSRRHGEKKHKSQPSDNVETVETLQEEKVELNSVSLQEPRLEEGNDEDSSITTSTKKEIEAKEDIVDCKTSQEHDGKIAGQDNEDQKRENVALAEKEDVSECEVVEVCNALVTKITDGDRKRRSPSRDSSEERAKQAALRSRRPKRKEGSEDGEVVESPEREITFPTRVGSRIRTTNTASKENAEKDSIQEIAVGQVRKRRWGSSSSSAAKKPPVSISTAVLKEIIPEAKPIPLSDVQLSPNHDETETSPRKSPRRASKSDDEKAEHRETVRGSEKRRKSVPSDESEKDYEEEGVESGGEEMVKKTIPTEKVTLEQSSTKEGPKLVVRSQAPDPLAALAKQRSPSPARHPVSCILYITNLVRPFTVVQLRDLLARTGAIVPGEGFWIDSIKSRCYVKYTSEEEAVNTRNALHGVRWPASNPKQLCVDYGSESAMKAAMEGVKVPPAVQKEPEKVEDRVKDRDREKEREVREKDDREKRGRDEKRHRDDRLESKHENSDRRIRIVEKSHDEKAGRTVRKVTIPVREWDLGKAERGFSPPDVADPRRFSDDLMEDRKRREKERGRRSSSFEPARKVKKAEEEGPPKLLLDDLFRKTKATPSIYWLPLTAQQIAVKEEMRRKHMENHEKLVAEQKKRQENKRRHPRSRSRSPKK